MKSFAVPPNMTVEQVLEMLAPKEPAAADEQPQPAPQPKRRSKQEP